MTVRLKRRWLGRGEGFPNRVAPVRASTESNRCPSRGKDIGIYPPQGVGNPRGYLSIPVLAQLGADVPPHSQA